MVKKDATMNCAVLTRMKTCTDLKGVFSVNVIIHRQHGYMEAWEENTAKYPFLLLICRQNKTKTNVRHSCQSISLLMVK